MLAVELTALNQQLDFASGQVLNVLVLRMPNGVSIPASIEPEHVQAIMEMFAERATNGGLAAPPPPPPRPRPSAVGQAARAIEQGAPRTEEDPQFRHDPVYDDGTGGVASFGGPPPELQVHARPDGASAAMVQPAPQARTVQKDEAGYPRLDGVDPRRITDGGDDADEDGVGSI